MTLAFPDQALLTGPHFTAADSGYAEEIAPYNSYSPDTPELVIGAANETDVIEAVRLALENDLRIHPFATGHGADPGAGNGLVITTRRLDRVAVEPATGIATISAGVRWNAVGVAADPHGLAPVSGSAPAVGAIGFLLGGGLGPLARSHGFGSDYLVGARVVTGEGEVLEVSNEQHPDLFWALRGGKLGLGIVTEARVRLVPLPELYGGSIFFDTPHLETALRAWVDWTDAADARATTSVALVHFPDLPFIPELFRGKSLLNLRFACPGPAPEGERLAAPLRAFAPVYAGGFGSLKRTEIGTIHNDPSEPTSAAIDGALLGRIDQRFVDVLLDRFGPESGTPLTVAEVRHLGEATKRDVPEGSAASGRESDFTLSLVGVTPPLLYTAIPAAFSELFTGARTVDLPGRQPELHGRGPDPGSITNGSGRRTPSPGWRRSGDVTTRRGCSSRF